MTREQIVAEYLRDLDYALWGSISFTVVILMTFMGAFWVGMNMDRLPRVRRFLAFLGWLIFDWWYPYRWYVYGLVYVSALLVFLWTCGELND